MGGAAVKTTKAPTPPKGVPSNAYPVYQSGGRAGPATIKNWAVKNANGSISTWSTSGKFNGTQNLPTAAPGTNASGGIFDSISSGITQLVQDPSKAVTNVLQPVEKTVNAVASDPKALTAIALAVAIPGIGAAIGESLMAAGVIGGAEAASAAAIAAGATAAEAAAAGAAATATATAIGTAVASTAAQVAQGVPVDKAITNTLVNVGVSQVSPVVAQEINSVIGHPAVSDAITSAAASGVKTAAAGGSSQDITTAMTAGLAGSAANSAYSSAANDYNSTTGKVLGSATAGAVTGGEAGAITNALTTAASSIGTSKPPSDTSTKPVAAVDGGGGDVEILPGQTDSLGGAEPATTPPVVEPKQGAYLPEATPAPVPAPSPDQAILDLINPPAVEPTPTPAPAPVSEPIQPAPVAELYSGSMPDESAAETERLARLNQQATAPAAVEPTQGAYLPNAAPAPEVPDIPAADPMSKDPAQKAAEAIDALPVSDTDKQIMDLISETPTEDQSDAETERLARKEAELAGAEKGAYLPDSGTDTKTTTYKPDIFTTTYLSPKTRTASAAAPTSALGSALGTTGLTSYRGAGEIEGQGTGGKRKNVWNVESLKLKDALGV